MFRLVPNGRAPHENAASDPGPRGPERDAGRNRLSPQHPLLGAAQQRGSGFRGWPRLAPQRLPPERRAPPPLEDKICPLPVESPNNRSASGQIGGNLARDGQGKIIGTPERYEQRGGLSEDRRHVL